MPGNTSRSILMEMVKKGTPVILVSHAFDGLPDINIRLVVMNNGRITYDKECEANDVEGVLRRECVVNSGA